MVKEGFWGDSFEACYDLHIWSVFVLNVNRQRTTTKKVSKPHQAPNQYHTQSEAIALGFLQNCTDDEKEGRVVLVGCGVRDAHTVGIKNKKKVKKIQKRK